MHEKNVRHGHISTLHIWPARRPLAACRAALIATLLPDPGTPEERRKALREDRRQGRREDREEEDAERPDGRAIKEETEGGILHWGRETRTKAADARDWFRAGNQQGLRRPRAAGARPVRRRRRDPAGGHAAGLRGRRRSTSTRSPGSSSNARWSTRRSSPGRSGRCPTSSSRTASSWRRSSRRIRSGRQKLSGRKDRRGPESCSSTRDPAPRPIWPGTSAPGASGF